MPEARCDIVILGGGVCGLWTLHTLLHAGYDAWLLERSALGDGQTIASQGILHAGAKYRLPGNAVDASRTVAQSQSIWNQALAGGGQAVPDLSGVRVIDRRTLLWTTASIGSRIAARGAAGILRTGVRKLDPRDQPAVFRDAPPGVE
ncbi:MAG TPA: FAD-binding oxidoreductase, partial [Phycisphaerales bacterium]|nr:FAD-binding oxidoreductase [Phycisphaerales bacterium]